MSGTSSHAASDGQRNLGDLGSWRDGCSFSVCQVSFCRSERPVAPPVWLIARRSSSANPSRLACAGRGVLLWLAGGRAAWLPPPRRAIWPGGRGAGAPDLRARGAQRWPHTRAILQIPRCRERLRELTTYFVAFMRRHASNPPPGAKFGNFPPPLGGKLPSFGSRRLAWPFYADSATFVVVRACHG